MVVDCALCVTEKMRLVFRNRGFDVKWYLIKRRWESLIAECELCVTENIRHLFRTGDVDME